MADGGTLFLDEVAELPSEAQAGLLRVIQEGRFFRLGGEDEIEVDVRIITATNRTLPEMTAAGTFREDLFYRLNVVNIHIPPLRDRPEDIPVIANNFMINHNHKKLSGTQISTLQSYQWPGNVRELENILERFIVLEESDFSILLNEHRKMLVSTSVVKSDKLEDVIRRHAQNMLDKHEGNKTRTAKAMEVSLNTLKKYLQ